MTEPGSKELHALPDEPKVSIFTNCKNGAKTIRRCIEGVMAQTYSRLELVFQDGGSTDGTLDIVREYIARYPGRIRLNHEPDSCGEEGFFRALKACEGEIIGSSMADEELLPNAVAWGVKQLKILPHAGAVYGDVYVTDLHGNVTGMWIARPFSLKGYLCREVDMPFAASFFRREAILGAGLLTRNWTWGIGEYEFWLRIALKYPICYVPGLIAKYAFESGTMSYRQFLEVKTYLSAREAFFERFYSEPDLPESIRGMKEPALAGLYLFIGEVLWNLKEYTKAQINVEKALELIPNGSRLLDLNKKVSRPDQDWDRKLLRSHILAHLAKRSPLRIVCYGAGNDFMEFLSSGVFGNHTIAAVIDNHRPQGDRVGGVSVIREKELGQIDHDVVVVTSSRWAPELRRSAVQWSIDHPPYIPVI